MSLMILMLVCIFHRPIIWNDGRLPLHGLVKRPGKARPKRLSNSKLEFYHASPSATLA